jgi:hypothetical protein
MSSMRTKIGVLIPLFLAGLFAACEGPRNMMTETRTVGLDGATRVEIGLKMGAGELHVRGAAQEALLEASFEFNRERNRPVVDYRLVGDKGVLDIRNARNRGVNFGSSRNRWDLALGQTVPLDLDVALGAGRNDLDLRGLKIQRVEINMGVGEMDLDFRGPHASGFPVKIDGGVGSGRIALPSEVGVRVKVSGGLGSIDARGLTKQGGAYVNDAYGKSAVTIDVEINAGIGSLELRCEPSSQIRT